MDLDALKYADLRQLAKSVGLKANMKAEKLLKALKAHFEQEDSENGNNVSSGDSQTPIHAVEEPVQTSAHVTKRRTARRDRSQIDKRKRSNDGGADTSTKLQEIPAVDDAKSAGDEDERKNSKRRKVFSAKDTEIPTSSEQPESKPPKGVTKNTAGKIPRHEGLMMKMKKTPLKPTTPNFKKLHEAHFSKMESIDSYVQRRNKQKEELKNSKELKHKLPVRHAVLFSPGVQVNPAPDKRKLTRASAGKTVSKDKPGVFKPSVLSANKINVRFSQATQDNEHKGSLVKTPARMSPLVPPTPTPGRTPEARVRAVASAATVNKTPRLSAFVFTGISTTPATNKKSFDLKASLSRPLNYKPHKGKLKPFGVTQENEALDKSQQLPSHQKNYKRHQVQTREERRVRHTEDRKQKKEKMLGAKRGLVMT
ncbi:nucleolar and spindle-associated protein 1 [Brachyhypopomus gauderio]|uniref:nucleolar and spindle-associated protein 1 n=1 Tax=Brachyhypopomus gauderio TaxID=698409 RepID=UPI00404249F1